MAPGVSVPAATGRRMVAAGIWEAFKSVTTSKKREIESGHFEVFRSGLLNFPDGEVLHEDNPDFLVITEEGPLGIELRQLFHPRPNVGPPLQALESNREAERGLVGVFGFVSPGSHRPLGFSEAEFARLGRGFVAGMCWFLVKRFRASA